MTVRSGRFYADYGQEKVQTTAQGPHRLGSSMVLPDGKVFKYSLAGEAIGAGQLVMQKLAIANHDMDLAVTVAAAIGAKSISATMGATAVTLDQYRDGSIHTNDGTGEGHMYRVVSNASAAASSVITAVLQEGDVVREALSTTDTLVGLVENPYKDVEIWDFNDVAGRALGVAPAEIANDEFFWLQSWGDCAGLIDTGIGIPALARYVKTSSAVDGSMAGVSTAVGWSIYGHIVGILSSIPVVTTDYGVVFLQISP